MVDASALLELLLDRARAAAVVQAVSATDMVAPDLVNAEVISALRRLERGGAVTPRRAAEAVDDLLGAPVERMPTLPLLDRVWRLRANLAVYDACYVALAQTLDCALVTGDQRLARAPALDVPMLIV